MLSPLCSIRICRRVNTKNYTRATKKGHVRFVRKPDNNISATGGCDNRFVCLTFKQIRTSLQTTLHQTTLAGW